MIALVVLERVRRSYVRFLRPDFLDEFAESCEIEDE
jgi:hypothetical protein